MAEKRIEAKCKGEKERYIHLNAEFKRIARRHSSDSMCRFSLVLLEEGVCYDQCIFLGKLY